VGERREEDWLGSEGPVEVDEGTGIGALVLISVYMCETFRGGTYSPISRGPRVERLGKANYKSDPKSICFVCMIVMFEKTCGLVEIKSVAVLRRSGDALPTSYYPFVILEGKTYFVAHRLSA
jgi:hypothetical protein